MSLLSRNPMALFNDLQRDMNRLFDNRVFPALSNDSALNNIDWQPSVDIHEDKKGYHLSVDLPGVEPKDIEVTTRNGVLCIRGARTIVHTDKEQKRAERFFGSFLREFSMPEDADLERISAKDDKGVLEVFVPKTSKPEPKRITVQ